MFRLSIFLFVLASAPLHAAAPTAKGVEAALRKDWHGAVDQLLQGGPGKSALFVLDRGEHALRIRAWLAGQARRTLDVQYFIWSQDNVGRLAHQALLEAARRGVDCRILVDDLLLDGPPELLQALDAHPRIAIKVYNPVATTGVSKWQRWRNLLLRFSSVN